MDPKKYPFRVELVGQPKSDCGQHKTRAGAERRIATIVKMSKTRRYRAEHFTVVDDRVVADMSPEQQEGNRNE